VFKCNLDTNLLTHPPTHPPSDPPVYAGLFARLSVLERAPRVCVFDVVAGVMEYWSSGSGSFPEEVVSFKYKLDTDLYAHAQAKTVARDIAVTRDGRQFATFSDDRYTERVRHFATLPACLFFSSLSCLPKSIRPLLSHLR
jgi:hypothetical protein